MLQLQLIDRVEDLASSDKRILSVLMYGSFIKGEGDQYSDIEFYIFYQEDFNHREWVEEVQKVSLFFTNEFGTEVAIFDNLIRGEFHFLPIEQLDVIRSWDKMISFEYYENMVLVDKNQLLTKLLNSVNRNRPARNTPENIDWLAASVINNLLMTRGLILRGEYAHAQQAFQYIQKYLLWLIRLEVGSDEHWESPSKKAENDLPAGWYQKYKSCVPSLEKDGLSKSFNNTLTILHQLFDSMAVAEESKQLLSRIGTL